MVGWRDGCGVSGRGVHRGGPKLLHAEEGEAAERVALVPIGHEAHDQLAVVQRCMRSVKPSAQLAALREEMAIDPQHTLMLWPGDGALTVESFQAQLDDPRTSFVKAAAAATPASSSSSAAAVTVAALGLVDLEYGGEYVTCSNETGSGGTNCHLGSLRACDLLRVGGQWFRALDTWNSALLPADEAPRLLLARADDCSVASAYVGDAFGSGIEAQRWSQGYTWSVTFVKFASNGLGDTGAAVPLEMLGAPPHRVHPPSALLHVRGIDCDGCYYLPRGSSNGALSLGQRYVIKVFARNRLGRSDLDHRHDLTAYDDAHASSHVAHVTPNAVPASPEAASLAVISGSELEISWCPPSLSAGDIHSFAVTWDSHGAFRNLSSPQSNEGASCSSRGFGHCIVSGARVLGPCPYSFIIGGLTSGTEYFARVAARNVRYALLLHPKSSFFTFSTFAYFNTRSQNNSRCSPAE